MQRFWSLRSGVNCEVTDLATTEKHVIVRYDSVDISAFTDWLSILVSNLTYCVALWLMFFFT